MLTRRLALAKVSANALKCSKSVTSRTNTLWKKSATTLYSTSPRCSSDIFMGFGGPHAGFLATTTSYSRKMPGRIIGVSVDSRGKPALRMPPLRLQMSVPNGIPLVYKFDPTTMKPLLHEKAQPPLSGIWLEKKGLLRAALEREEQMALKIAGYEDTNEALQRGKAYYQTTAADGPTDAAGTSADASTNDAPGSTGNMTCSESASGSSSQSQEEEGEVNEAADCGGGNGRDPILSQPLLVIIRHGKTEHNKLGLFTGWEDAGLAPEGRHEARAAGNLLRRHQVDFDIVYASWLSRAIETALLVINELDTLWIPVVKTWRLNERMKPLPLLQRQLLCLAPWQCSSQCRQCSNRCCNSTQN